MSEHKDCMTCDNQRINYSNVCQKCSDFCYWKPIEREKPSHTVKKCKDCPIGNWHKYDCMHCEKEKEKPSEPYPSPYSKEQEDFGKYIRVEKQDLEELKELVIRNERYGGNQRTIVELLRKTLEKCLLEGF